MKCSFVFNIHIHIYIYIYCALISDAAHVQIIHQLNTIIYLDTCVEIHGIIGTPAVIALHLSNVMLKGVNS